MLLLALAVLPTLAQDQIMRDDTGRVRAADFAKADGWLNTDRPVALKDLRGQVVLLDFWTYCCINCMHVIPDLKFLEDKYKDQPFVVIGVHSGKFDQEKDAQHIRNAVLRHNIDHPVAIDSDYEIWNGYTVRAWPTLILIDPRGYIVGAWSGEGHREEIDAKVRSTLFQARQAGTLAAKPLTFKRERETFKSGVLEFPGKVLADATGKRLFIADTNHHRVLVTDLDGQVRRVIGNGSVGLKDGMFQDAQFHQPQGMALSPDGNVLYVADTENHAVRRVDLKAQTVETIAGTGQQGRERQPKGKAKGTALSSPWDLALVGDELFIAMAGLHQIWVIHVPTGNVGLLGGNGREAAIDGGNREGASFAQPSGLAAFGEALYVADSEASTIRRVETMSRRKTGPQTVSVAGSQKLFGFGRTDGPGPEARFQHPLGVAVSSDGQSLYVADTFNNALRSIDLSASPVQVTTLAPTDADGKPFAFAEPGGLSLGGDTLYVADTNRHRVVAVDLKAKRARVVDVRVP
jgi:sugar lactone lactonase YvrE